MSEENDPNKESGWMKALKVLAAIVGIAVLIVIIGIGLIMGACAIKR